MRLGLGFALSFAGPILLGWLLVRRAWPAAPSRLHFSLGMPLGMGVVGIVYYLALLLTRSSWVSFAVSELLMASGIAVLATPLLSQEGWLRGRSPSRRGGSEAGSSSLRSGTTPSALIKRRAATPPNLGGEFRAAFVVIGVLAMFTLLFTAATAPYGQWDATAVWNLKARFIYESPSDPLSKIIDPALWDTQPDYPLLLPVLVARGWQYAGRDSVVVPVGLGILFTASTVLILVAGVRSATNATQSYVAGCLLLATPFFIRHGVSQYADVVISCFMTIAVVLLCVSDAPLFLAGLAAGLAGSTKNEGLLFVLIFVGAVVASRRSIRDAGRTFAGAAAGVVVLGVFKYLYSPANPIVHGITTETIWQRVLARDYHVHILKAFAQHLHAFGDWWIAPFVLVVVHVIVAKRSGPTPWLTAALPLAGMLVGYYAVYLLTPYDLDWHIGTSMNRLLLQLWPMFLLTYSLLAAGPAPNRVRDTLPRQVGVNG